MKNSYAIYYYSGTGNTKLIAEMLAESFMSNDIEINLVDIEDVLVGRAELEVAYNVIGIGHPVISFRAPKVVRKFIKLMPASAGKKIFLFKTAGDPSKINNAASIQLIEHLTEKGYHVFYDSLIAMPSNFFISYRPSLIKQLLNRAEQRVAEIAQDIINMKSKQLVVKPWLKALTQKIHFYEEKYGAPTFGKGFQISEACNLCGLCVEKCPAQNITVESGQLDFEDRCEMCMRCLYNCPQRAISNRYKFVVLKDGYSINEIKRIRHDDQISGDYVTSKTRGYFKHFGKYLGID